MHNESILLAFRQVAFAFEVYLGLQPATCDYDLLHMHLPFCSCQDTVVPASSDHKFISSTICIRQSFLAAQLCCASIIHLQICMY